MWCSEDSSALGGSWISLSQSSSVASPLPCGAIFLVQPLSVVSQDDLTFTDEVANYLDPISEWYVKTDYNYHLLSIIIFHMFY